LGFVPTGGNTRAAGSDWLHAGSSRANHFSSVHQLAVAISAAMRVDCHRLRNWKLGIGLWNLLKFRFIQTGGRPDAGTSDVSNSVDGHF